MFFLSCSGVILYFFFVVCDFCLICSRQTLGYIMHHLSAIFWLSRWYKLWLINYARCCSDLISQRLMCLRHFCLCTRYDEKIWFWIVCMCAGLLQSPFMKLLRIFSMKSDSGCHVSKCTYLVMLNNIAEYSLRSEK